LKTAHPVEDSPVPLKTTSSVRVDSSGCGLAPEAWNGSDPEAGRTRVRHARSGRIVWTIVASLAIVAAVAVWTLTREKAPPVSAAEARRQGLALYERGDYAGAVQSYERALSAEDDTATHTNLGNALKKLGRFDEAEAHYRRALALDQHDATAWYDLGNLMRDQRHDLRGAIEAFRNAIEFAPQMSEAHFSLGAALMHLNDFEAAVAEIQAALDLAPEDAPWKSEAGRALALARLRVAERKGLLPPPRK
jgi:tetratricopeptide (TPR) repeat protein